MPSRICSVLDCQRVHYAAGYCERHYRQKRRKAARAAAIAKHPASYVSGQENAANPPSNVIQMSVPRPTGDRAGVERPRTSPVPLLSAEGVAVHLLAFVRFLSGTGTRTAPSAEFGGFRWR